MVSALASKPLVCLLTAGRGERMGVGFPFNKALLPLGEKAVLTRIIERFPANTCFVIATGFCGEQVREYLAAAHGDREFRFVDVPQREGPGSGPGRSLLECAPWLSGPFFSVCCDTLWDQEIPMEAPYSWVGVAGVPAEERLRYCNFSVEFGQVTEIFDKRDVGERETRAFSGLCYIHDPSPFFAALEASKISDGELQFSHGFSALLRSGLRVHEISWLDVGTSDAYRREAERHARFDFGKEGEFLYFVGDKVVKFFREPGIVKNRMARQRLRPELFPEITFSGSQFYSYRFVPGKTLYESFSPARFTHALAWLEAKLWRLPITENRAMGELCDAFYREKTLRRVADWKTRAERLPEPRTVNGKSLAPLEMLLAKVPWETLSGGVPGFIHGDLQPDNILCTADGYRLIDWRQDFAGSLHVGDVYYDLAKLRGGLVANYNLIKRGAWNLRVDGDAVYYQLPHFNGQAEALQRLDDFARSKGFDVGRIELLAGLVFANMAPLHSFPVNQLMWNLARETLSGLLA